MKRLATALLLAAAALAANAARAHTNVSVGVRVGTPVVVPPAAVVVAPAPAYCPPPVAYYPPAVAYDSPAPVYYEPARGYWRDVTVKTWVPERWVMTRDSWGRLVRVCEPGYYTYRTERVWVDGRHDHGRYYDRDYRYGWNR